MTSEQVLAQLHQYAWTSCEPGLGRVRALLSAMGEPQKGLKFVHIAGSNGKGSTAAMLESVLRAAGYRTGLFTSPHLLRMNERMKVNGAEITDEELTALCELVLEGCRGLAVHPTEYELMCAMGMEHFRRKGCDIVVLEVGLGGRMDATNVIDAPEAALITNITLEHTNILGDSLEGIVWEKAGILKSGSRAVLYAQDAAVEEMVKTVAADLAVPLSVTAPESLRLCRRDAAGQAFSYRGADYTLALAGGHQLRNAAVVIDAVEALRAGGWNISPQALKEGLAAARWPGRLEALGENFLLDGAHNPQCVDALMDALAETYGAEEKFLFLVGVQKDKNWQAMLRRAFSQAARFITVAGTGPRALAAEEMAAWLREEGFDALAAPSVEAGARMAAEAAAAGERVCAWGSLYNAGEIRRALGAL